MNILSAADFNILPGSSNCYPTLIQQALKQIPEGSCLRFLPGTYNFLPGNAIPFSLCVSNSEQQDTLYGAVFGEGLHNITLDWQGSQLLFHEDLSPFVFLGCSNIQLQNVSVDWELPFSAEATVAHSSENRADIIIDPQRYPYRVHRGELLFAREDGTESPLFGVMEFDVHTRKARPEAGDTFPKVTASPVGPGMVRLNGEFSTPPKSGNILVLRHGKRIHPGLLADHCSQFQVSAVTMHHCCGLGMLFQFCRGVTASQVVFSPSTGREIFSGHDDGLHFSNCSGHLLIEHCGFWGLMDDPINVHGTSVRILEISGPSSLRCGFIHPQSYGFSKWACPGDQISCLDRETLAPLGNMTVEHFQLLGEKEFLITFSEPLPSTLVVGDALENLTNTPSVTCCYNHFGSCRARGMLVSTPLPVEIHHNLFESSGSAILIPGDANQWYESGACHQVSIHDNVFWECCTSQYQFCSGVISIEPEIPTPEKNTGFHENISVSNNTFILQGKSPCLYAKCCTGLSFCGNTIFSPQPDSSLLQQEYCSEVYQEENHLTLLATPGLSIQR